MLLSIERHPNGPRLRIFGQRIHHGATGCLLLAGAAVGHRRSLALMAGLAIFHDRRDVRVWFARGGQY